MRIAPLAVAAAVLFSANLIARADSIGTGTYGGTEVASYNNHADQGTGITYTDAVYADPSNPLCAGCLEFVITIDDPISTGYAVDEVSTSDFAGYTLEYAYADDSGDAPTSVSINKNGKVTFDFGNLLVAGDSDPLIIYTDATSYTTGSLTIGSLGSDPPAFAPSSVPAVTPEPSSIVLLGTGLLGMAGVLRRRYV